MELDQDRLRIAERAAEWHHLLRPEGGREPSARDKAAFLEWLDQSPVHVREFLMARAFDIEAGRVAWDQTVDVDDLLAQSAANVVTLRRKTPREITAPSQRRPNFRGVFGPRRVRPWIWGAAAALILGLGAVISGHWPDSRTYSTDIGELRSVELPDGSTVQLSAGSQLRVQFTRHARELVLLQGEALFNVEHDVTRPFRVHSAGSVVEAVGTRFDVDRRQQTVLVAVLEGRVRVFASEELSRRQQKLADAERGGEVLVANEQLRLDTQGHVQRREKLAGSDLQPQRLVFRDDTLADIAAEFNRYNQRLQIVIADERAGAKRYGGFFYADDPESLVAFISTDSEISVARTRNRAVISTR